MSDASKVVLFFWALLTFLGFVVALNLIGVFQ